MLELVKTVSRSGRTAEVYKDCYGYCVRLLEEGSRFIETRDVSKHSLYYAEDLAWNWVEGVIP